MISQPADYPMSLGLHPNMQYDLATNIICFMGMRQIHMTFAFLTVLERSFRSLSAVLQVLCSAPSIFATEDPLVVGEPPRGFRSCLLVIVDLIAFINSFPFLANSVTNSGVAEYLRPRPQMWTINWLYYI